jgi:DNA-binding LytR/AlgR family response regulator
LVVQQPLRETPPRLRETPAATGEARAAEENWLRNLAIAAAAGLFLAFSGAMQTGEQPLWQRIVYWVPLMIAGAFLGHGVAQLIASAPRLTASKWVFGTALAISISLPITVVVWLYTNVMFGSSMDASALPGLFLSVLVISAAMTAIMIGVNWPGRVTHAGPDAPTTPRFHQRLPPKLAGASVHAVSAEDHYLRVHTSRGNDLILMRLSDAITELEGVEGAQTHRSWWVAKDAVEGVRREGDRVILILKGGAEAPVSRPNVRALREAGWY